MKEHKGNERSSLGLERLVFFSDAVFAIAITLLVIDIRLPEDLRIAGTRELAEALWALLPRYVSYVISFVIIGSFWLKHHAMFEIIAAHDARLLVVNMVFLLFVAFLPFPTAVVGRYSAIPLAEALYSAWVAAAGFAKLALWLSATKGRRLLAPSIDPAAVRRASIRHAAPAGLFLISIPLAWVHWLAPVVVWMAAPVLSMLVGRRPRERRTDRRKSTQGPADGSRPRRRVMHSATARPEEPAQRSARSSS